MIHLLGAPEEGIVLRATTPREASDERELRAWLVNTIGATDERELTAWVHANHGRNGVAYVDALAHIVRETGKHGREFVNRILEFLRSIPPEQREAMGELLFAVKRITSRAEATIERHRTNGAAILEEVETVRAAVRSEVHRLWPDKHRASVDGALLACLSFDPQISRFKFDHIAAVQALEVEEPLAANAKASW